jgi:Fe-S oxidoreductase
MSQGREFIDEFKRIVGAANVLTDPEDIYVYSFEHFFRKKRFKNLAAVIRVANQRELQSVTEFANEKGVKISARSSWAQDLTEQGKFATILLDDVTPPTLSVVNGKKDKEQLYKFEKELAEAGYGSLRNFATALKSFFTSLPAQKCLNCDVCSGYCTVSSSFNGVETWSSKGRTLLAQGLFSGEVQSSSKLSDILYSCSLCGLCFAECFETTQVRKAIMEARHYLVEKGHAPELFTATAKSIFETGDPSGMPPSKRVVWTQQLPQRGVFPEKADVLLWSGCIVSTRTPSAAKALGNVLNHGKVDFAFLGEKEGCCGYVLLASGLWDEAKENAVKLIKRVEETHAETLITPCAGCYYTFTKMYPEILGVDLPCQIMHASQFVDKLMKEEKITPKALDLRVTYHDPCSLGRHCNVYTSPRNILKAVPNLDLVEMRLNRNRARCCGAGGGLWSYNNSVALNSASERLEKDVAPLGVSALVTACPTCYLNFRFAAVKQRIGIKVVDLMEIVEASLANTSRSQG